MKDFGMDRLVECNIVESVKLDRYFSNGRTFQDNLKDTYNIMLDACEGVS